MHAGIFVDLRIGKKWKVTVKNFEDILKVSV